MADTLLDDQKYVDCGDEISFNTVGYDIPASTLSRIGEQFVDYHMSSDNLDNFFLRIGSSVIRRSWMFLQ